jgi:hypothetical protein
VSLHFFVCLSVCLSVRRFVFLCLSIIFNLRFNLPCAEYDKQT